MENQQIVINGLKYPNKKSIRIARPWNDSDDGELTQRLAGIELQKAGVAISTKRESEMSKAELLEERSKLRRAANDFGARAEAASKRGDDADFEKNLRIGEEVGRWALLISNQLDMNEAGAEFMHGTFGAGQMRSAAGKRTSVLGKDDSFADAITPYSTAHLDFGIGEFCAAMINGTNSPDIRASLSEGTDSAGGYTVPSYLSGVLIDRMRAKMVAIRAGAQTVVLTSQTTTIARIASDPTAAWRAESTAIAVSDPTFEAITFTARSLSVMVKVSRELIADSININEAIGLALAGAMAGELDRVALFGSGTPPEPKGIFNGTAVNSVLMGAAGAQLTSYGKVLDCLYETNSDNAAAPSALVMHPRTARTLQGLADTTGQPLQLPPALVDIPQLVTTSVPITQVVGASGAVCSSIILGDFSQLLIGIREDLRITVLPELYAGTGEYCFIAHMRADVALAHDQSFCKLIGILA